MIDIHTNNNNSILNNNNNNILGFFCEILHYIVILLTVFTVCCTDGFNVTHKFKVIVLIFVTFAVFAVFVRSYFKEPSWDYTLHIFSFVSILLVFFFC